VFLAQFVLRPAFAHAAWPIRLVLGSAPNLIVGLCFPFAVLARPSLLARRRAWMAFTLGCSGTLAILVAFEAWRPIAGAQTYDPKDLAASVLGVALALVVYRRWIEPRLRFDREGQE